MLADFAQQYLWESADRTEPGEWKILAFLQKCIIDHWRARMDKGWALPDSVIMCMFVAGMEREKQAEREKGWVLFLPSAFHYILFPINTSISAVSKQGVNRVNGN